MNRQIVFSTAAAAALVLAAWSLTSGGGAKLSAQLQLATGSGQNPAWGVMRDGPVKGTSPGGYGAPCPPGGVPRAITGAHPILHHPKSCSPNMSAQMAQGYDWMFCPPSEDDL
jgi:hypothetical protein